MKTLRLKKHWSQEELAQMCNLNVRTIQRVEKGERVGSETLKALASVFEISIEELINSINLDKEDVAQPQSGARGTETSKEAAQEKVKSIKTFYASTAFIIATFLLFMLPNYNDGENLGPLIVVFLSFCVLIAGHAIVVFEPFGKAWEQKKIAQILKDHKEEKF